MKLTKLTAVVLIVSFSSLLFVDLSRLPEHQFTVRVLVFSIEKYCAHVSPHLDGIVTCKFTPSCSSYAIMTLKKHGTFKGTMRIITRLTKCSPLSSAHGKDYP
jgi:putative membrane protein insertion efficiency factor